MKKMITIMALGLTMGAVAAPISPIEGYQTSSHTKNELKSFWRTIKNINSKMKGKDCFKRANIWAYTLYKHDNVYSKKVFMHYTNKFNREIDDMGRRGAGALMGRILSHNKGWDFHVAPAVTVNGVDYIIDPHLRKTYEPTEKWVDFLTERGEYRLKIRQRELLKDLKKARRRLARSRRNKTANYTSITNARSSVKEIEAKLKDLGLTENPNQKIDIKCKKITNIMEFDANQDTEWCYYQETSMYYFGPLQLRLLNYGDLPGNDLRLPVTDTSLYTEENFTHGRNFTYERFDTNQLKQSLDEFKSDRPESIYDL